ncbi:hypothetical protein BLNAU_1604 [Blattamonas nauphoetae]|uniref:Protein kinase domain-containing protein n=1 Tax=Blattamonas nauphoetae TaxID=2049346 RepID=A0ABQ9YIS0_9EUKA|nr:hypothetical protein BLNAU_1604 [Blattamonas nauphoetae]
MVVVSRTRFESPNGHIAPLTKLLSSDASFCVSVVVKSIELSSHQLTSGNSVLLDITPSQSSFVENSEISTCIESWNVVNLTSSKSRPLIPARRLSQTCLGVSVSDCVGALQNTIVQDPNIGGSFHFQNNSISSSISKPWTSKDVFLTSSFPDVITKELEFFTPPYTFKGGEFMRDPSHSYWSVSTLDTLAIPPRFKYATTANPVTYIDCSFTKMTEEPTDPEGAFSTGGTAIRHYSQAPLSITNSTFVECQSEHGAGGAILISSTTSEASTTLTIEGSKFIGCTSVSNGGAICIYTSGLHFITRSSFILCQADSWGGGAYVSHCAVSYSEFVSNTALSMSGGLYAMSAASLLFCHFEGNTAEQDPDWAIAFPLNSVSAAFGCTQSRDSKVTDDVLFVASGEEGEDCSFSSPCGSLSAALQTVGPNESKEIKLGTGTFGEVRIISSSSPTICGYYRKEDWDSTEPSSSFSLLLDNPGTIKLTNLNLVPLTGAPIVECTVDASLFLNNLRMTGVDGISSPPFVFSAGTISFSFCHFDTLSSMKCSLTSISGAAVVQIQMSLFHQIESSSSVVSVVDGSLKLREVVFRHLTRTSGLGGAALDCENAASLDISAQFSSCHSKTGLCGAIHLNVTDLSDVTLTKTLFYLNRGRDESVAHDIHLSTITVDAFSSAFPLSLSSASLVPHIVDDSAGSDSIQPPSSLYVYDNSNLYRQIAYCYDSLTQSDVEALDLSIIFGENTNFDFTLCTTRKEMTSLRPIEFNGGSVSIASTITSPISALTQSSQTDGTLFTMKSSSTISISSCILILSTNQTDPMITIDTSSTLYVSQSILSSDGGLSNRAFCQSEGSITLLNTSVVSIAFSTHSCFETRGGSFSLIVMGSIPVCCVTNLSTSENGALLNAKDTSITVNHIPIVDCHAANGGAIFVQNCSFTASSAPFFRCSATHKGGAVCIENTNCGDGALYLSLQHIIDCSADLGGGLYICNEGTSYITIGMGPWMIFMKDFSYTSISGCKARQGSGAYFDGNVTTSYFSFYAEKYFNNSFAEGSDFFFSKTFADTHPDITELISSLCASRYSLSGRSFDEDGQYRHVEVEGYPQLSRNLLPPTMEVYESDSLSEPPTVPGPILYFNSLSYYLPYIHTQTDTGEYLPIPINLMSTLYFFETGTVTRQAIVLVMSKIEWDPVEKVEVRPGQGSIETGIPFVEVADEGSIEFSTTKFVWTIDNHLCRLVSRSAHSSITGCEFTIQLSMSVPLVECESGTLIITSSSFNMQAPPTDIFQPIVCSSSSVSLASNGKSGIEIEMSEVSFHNMTVQPGAAGVVVIDNADRIRLDRVGFVNVMNEEGKNGTRIVVHGRNLANVIECVPNSEFPERGGDEDDLYESLDENEIVGSPFHSPTLLLYLTFFRAQTILVDSIGRDGVWCGEATFPCTSLDEADLHLADSVLCTIAVVDVAQLKGEVDLRQDKTEIVSKGGDKSRVDVLGSGKLVNEAAILAHSLHLDSLAFLLLSGRSVALLESRSGMLTVTSCSFSSSSPLHSKLLEVTGGSVKMSDVDISSVAFSDTLLSFSHFSNVNVSSLAHRECSAGTLMSFEGKGKTESRVELQNCAFSGKNEKTSQNDDSLCFWTSSLIEIVSCSFESSLSTYSHLSQGGMHVVSSTVKMIGGESVGNNALSPAFPSLQRNIVCEKESLIELGTDPLESSSLWISTDSKCVVTRNNGSVVSNAFFIPTLTVKSCSSLFDKKTETFRLELNGTLLIPCGLTLVVSENTSSSNTEPVRIALSSERTTEWTETSMRMEVKLSEFLGLGEKREWVGHVEFGETGRTEGFSLKLSSKQAQSLAMQKTLPWLIPLIVSLVAILLLILLLWICCRRRNAAQLEEKAEMQDQDPLPVEDEKLEILDPTNQNVQARSHIDSVTASSINHATHMDDALMSSAPSQVSLVEALVCGHKLELSIVREQDTLYNALHVKKSLMAPKCVVRSQLALGLMKVASANRSTDILRKLSSHWVMFDGHGNVCLKTEEPKQVVTQAAVEGNGEVEVSASKDGQRWRAPEVAKAEEEKDFGRVVDGSKASVFSLGLVLWEIETGLVPFGELDGINAQRQIGTGVLPKMDGIHENMVDVISSCLQLDPDDRPTLSTVWSVLCTLSDSGEAAENNEHLETH